MIDNPLDWISDNETGNAYLFVREYGDSAMYVAEAQVWFVWTGTHWEPDTKKQVVTWMKEISTQMSAAARILSARSEDAGKTLLAWGRASGNSKTIAGSLKMTEPLLIASAEELDTDPWLLNCPNGTLDLRTCELREHRRKDRITRCTAASYVPGSWSARWATAIMDGAGKDQELVDFLRRAAGMTLVGLNREERFFFAHGPAASGKSTFTEPLAAALGDYALTAQVTTFLARQRSGNNSSGDVARLAGQRMVLTGEPDQGEKLASGFIKQLTGGDTITARFLYKGEFEFVPQCSVWFVANDRPYVDHGDEGVWRRMTVIPFEHSIPEAERDLLLKEALRGEPAEQEAILAWAVEGCREWQVTGLCPPSRVREASEAYRDAMNPLKEFVSECLDLRPDGTASTAELFRAYESNGGTLKLVGFSKQIAKLPGVEKTKFGPSNARVAGFQGVELRQTT